MNVLHQVRVLYRHHRRRLHVRLLRSMQPKERPAKPYRPRIYVDKAPVDDSDRNWSKRPMDRSR